MLLCELNRIHSHLVWLGTAALELGAISMFWYCFRERDHDPRPVRDGRRDAHAHALLPGRRARRGHPARILPRVPQVRRVDAEGARRVRGDPLRATRSGSSARRASACSPPTTRSRSDSRARCCARRASTGTCAATSRTSRIPTLDFGVPVYPNGDVYDRYRVRMDEMRESVRIIEQCLDGMPEGPWIADDRKVVLPPRHELHTSMESLIHHFKIVTEGYRVPEGEVYVTVESPRGEMGCYVVSDGGPKPWRVKFRAPSFVALEATATCMSDSLIADMIAIVGSLDTRHGGGRPLSSVRRRRDPQRRPSRTRTEVGRDERAAARAEAVRRLAPAGGARRGRRRARPDAGARAVGRVLLRHVPPRSRRRAPRRGLHERLVRARRRAAGRRRVPSRSSASGPARRARTARSRCGRSSAPAAAATRRSSSSTTATGSRRARRTSRAIVEELRDG